MGLKSHKFTKQSYKKCLQESIDTGVPFVDQEFKAADSSLFAERRFLSEAGISRVVWKRPLQLVRDPHLLYREKVCLFLLSSVFTPLSDRTECGS